MKNILYIGNKLASHNFNRTSIETLGPLLEVEGYKVIYASSQKSKTLRMLDMILTTLLECRRTDYVLIDTYSTYNFWYAFIISQLCRILNLPYIPKLHGGDLPRRLSKNPMLCRMIFNHSKVNIAPSGYLLDAFRNASIKNVIYVPNTVEVTNYTFKSREVVTPKLLWVRSLASIYNPEMALYVLSEVKKKYPDASLCMIGPDKENMLAKLTILADSLKCNVSFTGKLSKEEWTDLAQHYDIFINTTHFDNTPISVIEAMCLGLPVVSTNVGGIPFLIAHMENGLLVDDNDTEAMTESIFKLIDDRSLLRTLTQNAQIHIGQFDWIYVKDKWLEILS